MTKRRLRNRLLVLLLCLLAVSFTAFSNIEARAEPNNLQIQYPDIDSAYYVCELSYGFTYWRTTDTQEPYVIPISIIIAENEEYYFLFSDGYKSVTNTSRTDYMTAVRWNSLTHLYECGTERLYQEKISKRYPSLSYISNLFDYISNGGTLSFSFTERKYSSGNNYQVQCRININALNEAHTNYWLYRFLNIANRESSNPGYEIETFTTDVPFRITYVPRQTSNSEVFFNTLSETTTWAERATVEFLHIFYHDNEFTLLGAIILVTLGTVFVFSIIIFIVKIFKGDN